MHRLILFRHGKAEDNAASGDDFDRGLTDQGRAAAAAMGRLLAVSGEIPDLALVSSSARTVQTFEAARQAFPRVDERISRGLYLATAGELRAAIRVAAEGVRSLMLVGHNPGIHELALRLAHEGTAHPMALARLQDFPPAGVAVFDFDEAGHPHLQAAHLPKG